VSWTTGAGESGGEKKRGGEIKEGAEDKGDSPVHLSRFQRGF